MSAPTFEQLTTWIEAGHVGRVTDALLVASETERRSLAPHLKAYQPNRPPLPGHDALSGSDDPMAAY